MESRFVTTAFGRVNCRIAGKGMTVLFVHPRTPPLNNWQAWQANLGPMAAAGFRAIALELPGFGDAARPEGAISTESATECLLEVFERMPLNEAVLVGHSWGGLIAWRAAMLEPRRVRKLVLVAPDGAERIGGKLPAVISQPTLVVWHTADPHHPPANAQAFASAIPQARLRLIDAGGEPELRRSMPQLIDSTFNDLLIAFLKE